MTNFHTQKPNSSFFLCVLGELCVRPNYFMQKRHNSQRNWVQSQLFPLLVSLLIFFVFCQTTLSQANPVWPRPIPARTQDIGNKDLFVMVLGDAELKTVWQDGKTSEKSAKLKFTPKSLLPDELELSSLEPSSISNGWRQPEPNRTFSGKGLSVGGQRYENGIGMPTNSKIEFAISGVYSNFSALVGVDDELNSADGSVEFAIQGDGREVWRSMTLKKADGAVPVNVNIKGVQKLKLIVKRSEGQSGRAPANWLDAKLSEVDR
jgi:hypothetical protein